MTKFDDYFAFFLSTTIISWTVYYFYRKSKKYVQLDPYNARVDLHERYGKLEQRQVVIEELPTETLVLLRRDGKLNDATIRKLVLMGKLPDGNGKFKSEMVDGKTGLKASKGDLKASKVDLKASKDDLKASKVDLKAAKLKKKKKK